jgi:hypothetical protein
MNTRSQLSIAGEKLIKIKIKIKSEINETVKATFNDSRCIFNFSSSPRIVFI